MISQIKQVIYTTLDSKGYDVVDTVSYEDSYPWFRLSLNNFQKMKSQDLIIESIEYKVDVFSTYAGEEEVIDIYNDITDDIVKNVQAIPEVVYSSAKRFFIMDDKETGPVRKHGVMIYQFIIEYKESKDND